MLDFENSIELMRQKGLIKNNTTVARILHYIRDTLKIFNYDAIRVYGINSKMAKTEPSYRLKFEYNTPQYLDYKPVIQICIYQFSNLNFKNFQIVYPDEYIDDYVI